MRLTSSAWQDRHFIIQSQMILYDNALYTCTINGKWISIQLMSIWPQTVIVHLNISNQHAVHTQIKRMHFQQAAQPSRHVSLSKHLQVQLQFGLWIELQQLQQDFRSQHDFEGELLVSSTCLGCAVTVPSGCAIVATKWWVYTYHLTHFYMSQCIH